ncbi:MAG: TetR/AcrR family transcriptional regulator [Planctomycetes bacterium]|nr:TetR/AcrR family transcriptional regulator [Planctomycetota bacterium]
MVLDATEAVILEEGIAALTLEAVANRAGVSKGGLLYHYPSKDKLVEALVRRCVESWEEEHVEAIAKMPPGAGRTLKALLACCMGTPEAWSEAERRSSVVLMAALSHNPALIKPLRQSLEGLFEKLKDDGVAVPVAEMVILAMHGLRFEWMFGLQDVTPERIERVRSMLAWCVEAGEIHEGSASGTRHQAPEEAKTK